MSVCFFGREEDGLRLFGANHEVDVVLGAKAVSDCGEECVLLTIISSGCSIMKGGKGLAREGDLLRQEGSILLQHQALGSRLRQ